jgi:uncharacterized membrane protein YfcA
MTNLKTVLSGAVIFFATTAPVMAQGLVRQVPEPGVVGLLALAAAGVIIGRRMAYRKPPQD